MYTSENAYNMLLFLRKENETLIKIAKHSEDAKVQVSYPLQLPETTLVKQSVTPQDDCNTANDAQPMETQDFSFDDVISNHKDAPADIHVAVECKYQPMCDDAVRATCTQNKVKGTEISTNDVMDQNGDDPTDIVDESKYRPPCDDMQMVTCTPELIESHNTCTSISHVIGSNADVPTDVIESKYQPLCDDTDRDTYTQEQTELQDFMPNADDSDDVEVPTDILVDYDPPNTSPSENNQFEGKASIYNPNGK